jgi:predicted nucleic acid-binding protein
VPIDDVVLEQAETLPPATVGSLDAIHLATALRLSEAGFVDALMTYDTRLTEGARCHGLTVITPR